MGVMKRGRGDDEGRGKGDEGSRGRDVGDKLVNCSLGLVNQIKVEL